MREAQLGNRKAP